MSIQNLLARYSLTARSQGESEETIKHNTRIVGFFDKFMGGINDVAKIQADDLRRFILDTQEKEKWAGLPQAKGQKISATTVNTYTRAIKGFFKWLNHEGIIQTDPFVGVRAPKLPKRLPKVIVEKDMIAVFDSVAENPRETALLLLLLDSGITLSEVVELDDSYVDTASGTVRVFREKTQKERYAYFSPPTAAAIEAYRFIRSQPVNSPRLFLTQDGYPLTAKRVQKVLERVGQRAGISQRLSPHKLRHSFATWSLRYGSNLEYIRIMLGHSDIRTTSRAYLHMANADVAEASKRTSPVVNLGFRKSAGRLVKPAAEQNGGPPSVRIPRRKRPGRGNEGTVIIIQTQPQGPPQPHPADGIMPVTYIKNPRTGKLIPPPDETILKKYMFAGEEKQYIS